jgi:hypothetical protein
LTNDLWSFIEELFLAIQEQQFEQWFAALDAGLRATSVSGSVAQVAESIVKTRFPKGGSRFTVAL